MKFQFVEQITRAHFYTPFGVVHYARNLALPEGEPRGGPPATAPYVIIAQRNGAHLHRYAPLTCLTNAPRKSRGVVLFLCRGAAPGFSSFCAAFEAAAEGRPQARRTAPRRWPRPAKNPSDSNCRSGRRCNTETPP